MVKKLKFLSLLKNTDGRRSSVSSWGWPYCHPPQTLSFRANKTDAVFKTINSAYIDHAATTTTTTTNTEIQEIPELVFTESPLSCSGAATATNTEIQQIPESVFAESPLSNIDAATATATTITNTTTTNTEIQEILESIFTESPLPYTAAAFATTTTSTNTEIQEIPESVFTESPLSVSFSTASEMDSRGGADPIEILVRGLRYSDRLFFEPEKTNSIFEANADKIASESFASSPFRNSVVLPMDSRDPYWDFRNSMEEMAEAHGVNTWEGMEELLCLYLKVNEESNHECIVDAYVDFLKDLAVDSNDPCPSPASLYGSEKEVHVRAPSFSPWLSEQTPKDEASPSYSNT